MRICSNCLALRCDSVLAHSNRAVITGEVYIPISVLLLLFCPGDRYFGILLRI